MFLAQVLGPAFVIVALGVFMNRQVIRHMMDRLTEDNPVIWFSGFVRVLLGLLIVVTHNVWVWNWQVLITLIGWIALIKGVVLLWWPAQIVKMKKTMMNDNMLMFAGLVALIIGAVLSYYGYMVK
ncbi:MAG: hypothetical protein A2V81_03340 [Candidatus Abawacabacteria bacterium RBG_16_42_10]|uniref:Integral membrane protein (PIN domain superfamily) n=1 Tax=Candidatus Abawacabacteria bacterium RBG_16_42_10 TaxID=1817814 RepID=A0A1F4XJP9_9BACT|nr:MAG: hypothetical protein A2V81_03340 [Candidatus Abawacabacteria bacterium RBG_16_42_10]